MAGPGGYKFVFGSLIFYGFLAMMLTLGDGAGYDLLASDIEIPEPTVVAETGNWLYDLIAGGYSWVSNQITVLFTILINPFSGIGVLAWLSTAILFTNIYIIVTSLIP